MHVYSEIAEEKHKYVPPKQRVHPKLNFPSAGFSNYLNITPMLHAMKIRMQSDNIKIPIKFFKSHPFLNVNYDFQNKQSSLLESSDCIINLTEKEGGSLVFCIPKPKPFRHTAGNKTY